MGLARIFVKGEKISQKQPLQNQIREAEEKFFATYTVCTLPFSSFYIQANTLGGERGTKLLSCTKQKLQAPRKKSGNTNSKMVGKNKAANACFGICDKNVSTRLYNHCNVTLALTFSTVLLCTMAAVQSKNTNSSRIWSNRKRYLTTMVTSLHLVPHT